MYLTPENRSLCLPLMNFLDILVINLKNESNIIVIAFGIKNSILAACALEKKITVEQENPTLFIILRCYEKILNKWKFQLIFFGGAQAV